MKREKIWALQKKAKPIPEYLQRPIQYKDFTLHLDTFGYYCFVRDRNGYAAGGFPVRKRNAQEAFGYSPDREWPFLLLLYSLVRSYPFLNKE